MKLIRALKAAFTRRPVATATVSALLGLIGVWTCVPIPVEWVEQYYSRGLFRRLGSVLVPLSAALPFSLTFCGAVGAALVFGGLWGREWRRVRRASGRHREAVMWGVKRLAAVALLAYVTFLVVWGAGYRRVPLADRLELGDSAPLKADMAACAEALLKFLLRSIPQEGERDVARALHSIRSAMIVRVEEWDGTAPAVPARVKELPAGWLLAFGSSGITSPFLLEAHVDGGLYDVDIVNVAAHELAHVAGFCSEAEAELVAHLSGLSAADSFARYAVGLRLLADILRQLEERERQRLSDRLPPLAHRDLRASLEARRRYRVLWLARVQAFLYDSYLKSQGVDDGIASYSTGVRYFALAWRKGIVRLEGGEVPGPEAR